MRKHAVTLTLLAFEGLLAALGALFYWAMRPALLREYGPDPVPSSTEVALSPWLIPAAVCSGLALVLAGCLPIWRTKRRTWLLGTGVVVTAFALGFAMWAGYAPAFGWGKS